jgi:hypothetical protein
MLLDFDTNHLHVMTHDSDPDESFSDDGVPSPEQFAFDVVLREMLATHAGLFANGKTPKQGPADHTRVP